MLLFNSFIVSDLVNNRVRGRCGPSFEDRILLFSDKLGTLLNKRVVSHKNKSFLQI